MTIVLASNLTNTIIAGGCGRFGLTDNGGNLDDGTAVT